MLKSYLLYLKIPVLVAAIADNEAPSMLAASACFAAGSTFFDSNGNPGDRVDIVFSEPVVAALAEAGTYTNLPAGSSAINYDTATNILSVHYEANTICAGLAAVVITTPATVTDIAGNAIDATANTDTF